LSTEEENKMPKCLDYPCRRDPSKCPDVSKGDDGTFSPGPGCPFAKQEEQRKVEAALAARTTYTADEIGAELTAHIKAVKDVPERFHDYFALVHCDEGIKHHLIQKFSGETKVVDLAAMLGMALGSIVGRTGVDPKVIAQVFATAYTGNVTVAHTNKPPTVGEIKA